MAASPYDALLEQEKSPYDALLEPAEPQKASGAVPSPWALATSQGPAMMLGKILDFGKSVINEAVPGFLDQATTSPVHAEMQALNERAKPTPSDTVGDSFNKAVFRTATGLIDSTTSPAMIATLGAGTVPSVGKAVAAGFGLDMASAIPGQVKQAIEAPTTQERIEGGLGASLSALFATGAAAHVRGGLAERLAPIIEPEAKGFNPEAPIPAEPLIPEPVRPVEASQVETAPKPAETVPEATTEVLPNEPTISSAEGPGRNREATGGGEVLGESPEQVLPTSEPVPVEEPGGAKVDETQSEKVGSIPDESRYLAAVKLPNGDILTGTPDRVNPHQDIEAQHGITGERQRGFVKDGKFYNTFWEVAKELVAEKSAGADARDFNPSDAGPSTPSEATGKLPNQQAEPISPAPAEGQTQGVPVDTGAATVSRFRRMAEEMKPSESTGFGLKASDIGGVPGVRKMIDTWADRVRSLVDIGDSVKRFVKSSGQRDEVAAKFDAANNGAGYVARQARRHVELAGGDVKLPASELELQQRAATFVRQANGDKAGMLAKLQAIRGKGYDSIISYVEKNWDALERVSEAAKQGTDAAFNEAETAGVAVDYRDNYVKGSYHDPVTQKVVFDEAGGGRGTGTSFKKGKVFNDYAEAIAAGFKPRELRLDVLTESAVNATLRVVNRKKWAQSLGEVQMPDGAPAVAAAKENGGAPRGYKPVQVTPGNLVNIHEDLAPTIQALTADSAFPKLLSHGGAFLKHNILVFDIFHASRFAQMQGAFEAKIPSYHKGLALLEFADKDLTAAQKHGLITPKEAAWARENRPKIEGLIQSGLNAGRISDAIYAEAVPLMPGAKQTNNFIFQKLSRGVITQSAVYALERNAKLHPDWTPEQLNRYTAKEVNTYYRNLGNQGLFKSKTFQDISRALIFAPQWIEGMVRSEGRGYGQLGKLATTGKLGNVGKGMATGLVAYFAFAQVVNMLTRGKPTWENDEPGHKLDAWIPDSIQGSNGFFVSPLSVFAETTHDAIKYTERGMEPLDVSSQLLTNKLHPQVRAMRDLFGGKDFFGRPLHGFERVVQAAADVAPVPLFARTGGYKGGVERQLLSTAGIKATAAPSSTNDIYHLATDFKRKSGIKVPDQGEESDYAKLRRALQNGDNDQAKLEYDDLRKNKTADKIEDYFKNYERRPFTGSKDLEDKFKKSLDRGQLDIYNSALREREELGRLFRSLRK